MGVNSLPKTVTRQRRDCDLNPGHLRQSSTLTTRLPSHHICTRVGTVNVKSHGLIVKILPVNSTNIPSRHVWNTLAMTTFCSMGMSVSKRTMAVRNLPHRYASSCGISQCYLPPGRGYILIFSPAKAGIRFSQPR